MSDSIIRQYQPSDREAIRRICCDTANKGEPVDRFFPDREVFGDLLTRYYTDDVPQETWVADCGGRVAGYLTGCFDTHLYAREMIRKIIPAAMLRGIRRGLFLHRQTWRILAAGAKALAAGESERKIPLEEYPAHLHMNLSKEFRGKDLGRLLMEKFVEQAQQRGVTGIHLMTRKDNLPARRFFERMEFRELGERAGIRLDGDALKGVTVVYGRKLSA